MMWDSRKRNVSTASEARHHEEGKSNNRTLLARSRTFRCGEEERLGRTNKANLTSAVVVSDYREATNTILHLQAITGAEETFKSSIARMAGRRCRRVDDGEHDTKEAVVMVTQVLRLIEWKKIEDRSVADINERHESKDGVAAFQGCGSRR